MHISIVIPTLNEEHFIKGILDDLCSQDYKDFDIIHVDGKSDDETCSIVNSYKGKLSIKTVLSDKRNLSYQRNLGADHAKGKYIIFIDADTRLPDKAFLSKLVAEITKSKHLIYLLKIKINNQETAIKVAFNLLNRAVETSQLFPTPIPTAGIAIFERNFFDHVGRYAMSKRHDTKALFAEDQEILKRSKSIGVAGKFISDTYYVMSLRRFEREGWLNLLPKLLMSTIEQSIGKTLFDSHYEMGGHMYKDKE